MVYVISKRIVAQSLSRLRNQRTHTLFAGYLHLQQRATKLGRLENLQPDFSQFFKQFFYVDNHPLGAPYIKPFTEQQASTKNLWLNENIAGSYAPSSLRAGQPFRQVVNIEEKNYSFPPIMLNGHLSIFSITFRFKLQTLQSSSIVILGYWVII